MSQNTVFNNGRLNRVWYNKESVHWLTYIEFRPTEPEKYLWDFEIHCTEADEALACSIVDPCYQRAFVWISPEHEEQYLSHVKVAGFDPMSIPESFNITRIADLEEMIRTCVNTITMIHGRNDKVANRAALFLESKISSYRLRLTDQANTPVLLTLITPHSRINSDE